MKTALYLFTAGVLVAQAKLRPEIAQDDQLSIWGSIGHAFKSAADHVASGVTSAADTVASGTTSAADKVASGVTTAADAVASGTTTAADTVASGTTTAADAVAQVSIKAYQASASVVDQVADDFENGADFVAAAGDWVAVTFSNPQTYINAIQSTAKACSTYFNDLNALTGGQLTIENLEMADEVLDMVFPEGAVVFDGITIALELAEGTSDITANINGISNGIQTKNYMEVVQNSFELFQTILELSGEGEDGDDDAEDF